jgi:hypothetical protein
MYKSTAIEAEPHNQDENKFCKCNSTFWFILSIILYILYSICIASISIYRFSDTYYDNNGKYHIELILEPNTTLAENITRVEVDFFKYGASLWGFIFSIIIAISLIFFTMILHDINKGSDYYRSCMTQCLEKCLRSFASDFTVFLCGCLSFCAVLLAMGIGGYRFFLFFVILRDGELCNNCHDYFLDLVFVQNGIEILIDLICLIGLLCICGASCK